MKSQYPCKNCGKEEITIRSFSFEEEISLTIECGNCGGIWDGDHKHSVEWSRIHG